MQQPVGRVQRGVARAPRYSRQRSVRRPVEAGARPVPAFRPAGTAHLQLVHGMHRRHQAQPVRHRASRASGAAGTHRGSHPAPASVHRPRGGPSPAHRAAAPSPGRAGAAVRCRRACPRGRRFHAGSARAAPAHGRVLHAWRTRRPATARSARHSGRVPRAVQGSARGRAGGSDEAFCSAWAGKASEQAPPSTARLRRKRTRRSASRRRVGRVMVWPVNNEGCRPRMAGSGNKRRMADFSMVCPDFAQLEHLVTPPTLACTDRFGPGFRLYRCGYKAAKARVCCAATVSAAADAALPT